MPPKTKLPAREIADLTAWVAAGAHWPNAETPTQPAATVEDEPPPLSDEDLNYWAFNAPHEPAAPPVEHNTWPKSPLDHFVLASLEAKGLSPAPPADSARCCGA